MSSRCSVLSYILVLSSLVLCLWSVDAAALDPYSSLVQSVAKETEEAEDFRKRLTALDDLDLRDPVVNRHKFSYIVNSENACDGNVFLVILTRTDPDNLQHRKEIRDSWGTVKSHGDSKIVHMFIMGKSPYANPTDGNTLTPIEDESEKYHDIIQADFVDNFRNDTVKHLYGLHWVKTYCNQAKFFLSTDDSTMVDPYHLVDFLSGKSPNGSLKNFLYCSRLTNQGPNRTPNDQTFVTETEYPYSMYPDHCERFAYILSNDLVSALLQSSATVPAFWVGEVYVTGFLPAKLGVPHTDLEPEHSYHLMLAKHIDHDLPATMFLVAEFPELREHWKKAWDSIVKTHKICQ